MKMVSINEVDFLTNQNLLAEFSRSLPPSIVLANADGESWRQYVPLAVSCFVILDILLGNPVVNLILSPMRRAADKAAEEKDGISTQSMPQPRATLRPKMSNKYNDPMIGDGRSIDVDELVRQTKSALEDKAEFEEYLEKTKTDVDRINDLKNKIERQLDK
eukprot:CAMPEP_0113314282 /NCGR_PEP_ID=MMETSP0010_2-20120614/10400_1 /TAXON_ID=216773 ORGANISM="Corethron hystrix, Strain 308" /NCGR_SAMPLE_ID=MMETSP0010_2 /ASSEMBLY_ACC=CAM_ASM_000155 /LENGTH=160 /DNA_ID=CAMNT_0000170527 /DNA_START=98 /DNA_END=580 /DNA_ORIENTATION=- /assembly_acc=CAM_ASM_000155